MQRRTKCWILVVTGLLSLLNSVSAMGINAQQEQSPLIIGRSGELWSWPGTGTSLTQLTFSKGYVHQFTRSPDGNKVAYKVIPPALMDWMIKGTAEARDGAIEGQIPEDIRILDLESHMDSLIAGQSPVNPQLPLGKGSVKRSRPSWSPDGHSLTWLENRSFENPSSTPNSPPGAGTFVPDNHLIIYNVTSKVKYDSALKFNYASAPIWGTPGIVLRGDDSLILFDTNGKPLSTQNSPGTPIFWLEDGQTDYLAIQYGSSDSVEWAYLDILTGERAQIDGQLEMYSLTAPDGFSFVLETNDNPYLKFWEIRRSGKKVKEIKVAATLLEDSHIPFDLIFGISPDGSRLAFSWLETDLDKGQTNIYVFDSDNTITLNSINDAFPLLSWGPMGWRLRHYQ